MPLAPSLTLSGVDKAYDSGAERVTAVDSVVLTGAPGEFVCIHGASGSGKSTLLNLTAGLDTADKGQLTVAGTDLARATEEDRAAMRLHHVGVVFQSHNLVDEFTALENVALPLEAAGASWSTAAAHAADKLAVVGLSGLETRLPAQLSGGQRQRVGIARALVGDRSILLADEPTGALDSAATLELFGLIRRLCDDGMLAVVCSHDARCRDFADASYEMVDGRLTRAAVDIAR